MDALSKRKQEPGYVNGTTSYLAGKFSITQLEILFDVETTGNRLRVLLN